MFPSAICRLSVPLAASIFRASIAVAETTTVGAVDKVQAQVEATQAGQTRGLVVNSDVYFRDRCHSRGRAPSSDAERRHSTDARRKCDIRGRRIHLDLSRSRGELSVRVVKGAFPYVVGGLIERGTGPKVQVRTPLGLRLRPLQFANAIHLHRGQTHRQ